MTKNYKMPSSKANINQAMDYVAAYNRLKAQFRQESGEELPYIFKDGANIIKSKQIGPVESFENEQIPKSLLEHYKNTINIFDENVE